MAHDDNWLGPKTGSRMVVAGAAAASDANSSPRRWPMACTSRCWTCPRPCAPTAALPAPDTSALTRLKSSPWSRRSHRSGAPGATSMRSCSFAAIRYCRAVLAEVALPAWNDLMSVNLTSAHILVRELLPLLRASETPSITTVASSLGYQVMPGMGAYAASKGALVSLTKAFAMELAPHVRANVVAPGAVETAFLGGGTGREDIVSDRGWFDQLSDKYVSSIPLGRVASPPTSSGPSCFFPDRVPATSRAGPASERRQVDPLKVEDGYAATRASVFDRTTAGYLSRAVRCVRTRQRQDPVRSGLAIERAIRPGSPRNVRPVQGAGPGAGDRAVFHGGYWQSRDKSQFRFMAGAWAKAGFNVALAGYRLCPDISVRDLTASIQAVPLAVVHALPATQRNLPIILAGHSAGAHLAMNWRWHGRHATRQRQRSPGSWPSAAYTI